LGVGIPDDDGIALFTTASSTSYSVLAPLDAVGFNGVAAPYREGTGLTPIGSTVPTAQYAFVRKYLSNGTLQDTGNNANDFLLVATDAGTYGPSSVKATLGGPNPES